MTAAMTAAARAAHLLWGGEPPVFADEFAIRLIPDVMAEQVRSGPLVGPAAGAALMIIVRSRYAENALFEAVGRGTNQYVLLGAGLDSFAYRHRDTVPGLRVFEVDEPASQKWKRARLATADVPESDSVAFVPVDFATQRLDQRLVAAGLDLDAAVFFSWLGVVYYLRAETIDDTMRFISTCRPGTEVVFDYMDPTLEDSMPQAARMTGGLGEPQISKFTPDPNRRSRHQGRLAGGARSQPRRGSYRLFCRTRRRPGPDWPTTRPPRPSERPGKRVDTDQHPAAGGAQIRDAPTADNALMALGRRA
jgi:methyltransferase (TIGR00027 family)